MTGGIVQTKRVLAIYRLPVFSNNAVEADRLILEEAVRELEERSTFPLLVDMIEEPEVEEVDTAYDLVLTMTQSEQALSEIDKRRHLFRSVWNSTDAIRACYRKRMAETLINARVDFAPFSILSVDQNPADFWEAGSSYWLKRSDFHAISDDDVTLAEWPEEAQEKLEKFKTKGVKEVLLQKHVNGDIYKFYGVEDRFFKAIRVRKFLSIDRILPERRLQKNAENAAKLLGLKVYGGDCILDAEGNLHVIDLNDWPSFRICRPQAAAAIASLADDYLRTQPTRHTPSVSHAGLPG
jgi:hypothetical protein